MAYGKELNDTELLSNANLEGYYRFESGSFLTDSSGNGITLTNNNSVSEVAAQFGNGASGGISNSTKYLSVANLFNTTVNSNKTLSVWFKALTELTGSDQYHNIASISYSANNAKYQILYARESSVNKIYFIRQRIGVANETVVKSISLGTTDFHHIVLVLSGTTMSGYLDGALVGSVTINTGNGSSDNGNGLGILAEVNGTTFTDGVADDVAIFSRALTETEIAALYFNSPRYGDWTGSKKLYIPLGKVSGSSNLTDFPVLIKDGALPSAVYSGMQSDDDIRFTTDLAGEIVIPHETVSITRASDLSEIWLKLPTAYYNQNTDFYVWYGNAAAPAVSANGVVIGSQKVWSDYAAVYHLKEASGTRNDSSANAYHLSDNNTVTSEAGKIGTAASFALANSEYLTIADASAPNLEIAASQTWQNWFKFTDSTASQVLMGKKNTIERSLYKANASTLRFYIDGLSSAEVNSGVTPTASTWYHLVGVYDSSAGKLRIFVNASKTEATVTGSPTDTNGNFSLGRSGSVNSGYVYGAMDEARIRASALSDDWIATEYSMMNDPGTFVLSVTTMSFTESVAIGDKKIFSIAKNFSESVVLDDSLATLKVIFRAFTESVVIGDSILKIIEKNFSESVSISGLFSTLRSRSFTDSLRVGTLLRTVLSILSARTLFTGKTIGTADWITPDKANPSKYTE
jgi:hypothetical protein